MGSLVGRAQARTAASSKAATAWSVPASGAALRRPSIHAAASRMRFSVKVPVLSTHSRVAPPSASTTAVRRTRTCFCASRRAPRARKTVSTIGNSSGIRAMAMVSPARAPPDQSSRIIP
ncbi:hypothetical protein D3C80_966040 [compost metagenome]